MSEEQITLSEIGEQEGEKKTRVGPKSVVIPAEWDVKFLNEIASVSGGKRLPKGHSYSNQETDYPYIRVVDFESGSVSTDELKYINKDTHNEIQKYTISDDDVYISIAGTLGIAGTIPDSLSGGNLTENAAKIHDLNGVHRDYLSYYIRSKFGQDEVHRFTVGSTQPKLSLFRLRKLETILPPLPEQRKIATVLYTVDRAIKKTENVIESYESVREGILRETIARGVTEDGKFRPEPDKKTGLYSETRWGLIPEAWNTEKVSELVVDDRGVTYGIVKAGEHVPGGIPMIRGENYISGWEPLSEFFRVSEEIHKEYSRSAVRSGDILLAVAGANAGAVNIVPEWMPEKTNISRSTARISVDESDVIPKFMRYVLESPFLRKQIHAWKKGSAQDVLNLGDVKKFEIPIPPMDEQERIVSILSNIRERAAKERRIKSQYSRIKRGLMQDLLSGTVRTTDTNIEVPEEVARYG